MRGVFVALALLVAAGCVETAECDKNIGCGEVEGCAECVCFRKFCKQPCESDDQCGEGERCVACEGSCLGAQGTGRVCVVPDVCEPVCKGDEVCCRGACVTRCVLE